MNSILKPIPVTWISSKEYQRPRMLWSRRDYQERLNLRRIAARQQPASAQFVSQQEDVSCEQN